MANRSHHYNMFNIDMIPFKFNNQTRSLFGKVAVVMIMSTNSQDSRYLVSTWVTLELPLRQLYVPQPCGNKYQSAFLHLNLMWKGAEPKVLLWVIISVQIFNCSNPKLAVPSLIFSSFPVVINNPEVTGITIIIYINILYLVFFP